MSDFQDLASLLDRESAGVKVPAFDAIVRRSRRRRQRRLAAGVALVLAVGAPISIALDRGQAPVVERVAQGPKVTLDAYLQDPQRRTGSAIRISGEPVVHLHVEQVTVQRGVADEVQLSMTLAPSDQAAFTAFGPGDVVAFVVKGRLLGAPLFQVHIQGDLQLTGSFTSLSDAEAVARQLTDNVYVQ